MLAQSRLPLRFQVAGRENSGLNVKLQVLPASLSPTAGRAPGASGFNFGRKFNFFFSVTPWHYSSIENLTHYSSTDSETQAGTEAVTVAGPPPPACGGGGRPAPRLVVPPAGQALPGQHEAARLSSAQVVRQASRMQQ